MLVYAQNAYLGSWDNLDKPECSALKKASLAWLIINYSMLGGTVVYSVFFILLAFCDCDYNFDDYEIKY